MENKTFDTYKAYAFLRDSKGVTDYRVAKDTGIQRSTFSNWKNKGFVPKIEKLKTISNYFGVPITVLIGEK